MDSRTPWALCLVLLAGCRDEAVQPAMELMMHDGQPSTTLGEYYRVPVTLGASQYGSQGLLFRLQLRRSSGARAELLLDVPLGPGPGVTRAPLAALVETRGGEVVFKSTAVAGRIEVTRDDGCPCQTGRVELQFTSAGPDGVENTADDEVRSISRARLRRDGRPFCHQPEALAIKPGLLVVGTRSCPVGARAGGASWAWGGGGWVSTGWNDDGWYDDGWCGDAGQWADEGWDGWESSEGWTGCDGDCGDSFDGSGSTGGPEEVSGGPEEVTSGDDSWWDDGWDASGDSGDSGDSSDDSSDSSDDSDSDW
jgi:hypothetical protein